MTASNISPNPYPDARAYTAPDITVFYDRTRCVHFAECVRGLPAVFDVAQRPWIQPVNAPADEIAAVVERCASGALHYQMTERREVAPQPTVVQETPQGQILLRGDLLVVDDAGTEILRDTRVSACGCGASSRRPFCDSTCEAVK